MSDFKAWWSRYKLDRLFGVAWVLAFALELFVYRYFKVATGWLPIVGLGFCAVSLLRAGVILWKEGLPPLWFLVACAPGSLAVMDWLSHLIKQVNGVGEAVSGWLMVLADVSRILPAVGAFVCMFCLVCCLVRLLAWCFPEIFKEH